MDLGAAFHLNLSQPFSDWLPFTNRGVLTAAEWGFLLWLPESLTPHKSKDNCVKISLERRLKLKPLAERDYLNAFDISHYKHVKNITIALSVPHPYLYACGEDTLKNDSSCRWELNQGLTRSHLVVQMHCGAGWWIDCCMLLPYCLSSSSLNQLRLSSSYVYEVKQQHPLSLLGEKSKECIITTRGMETKTPITLWVWTWVSVSLHMSPPPLRGTEAWSARGFGCPPQPDSRRPPAFWPESGRSRRCPGCQSTGCWASSWRLQGVWSPQLFLGLKASPYHQA